MNRIGRVLVLTTLVAMFIPAFAQSASAACNPGDPGYPSCPPTVSVDNTNPRPGDAVVVSGSNWCPGSTVQIFLDGVSVGSALVNGTGDFSTSITIPLGTSPGPHDITVQGLDGSCQTPQTGVRTIVVSGAGGHQGGGGVSGGGIVGGAAQGGNLPFTGSNISAGMLILFALLMVGAVSLVAGRRRNAHSKE